MRSVLGVLLLGVATLVVCEGVDIPYQVGIGKFFTDLKDRNNPTWSKLKATLKVGTNSFGPAFGSTIRVNGNETKEGSNVADRDTCQVILHTPTHSYISQKNFSKMTRWYQEDGNTQIFRLFPGDDNVRNARKNAPRSEAFSLVSWKRGDGWHEWSGRYTFLKVRQGAVLQIKHNVTYWSMQLNLEESSTVNGTFDLYYQKLRDKAAKTLLMEDVVGQSVDISVFDDGENHEVYVNGELLVVNSMTDRPKEDQNRFRWGLYSPKSAMDRDILILVTGAYVGPWKCEGSSGQQTKASSFLHTWLSWFASFFHNDNAPSHLEFDAEPDPTVLSEWYDNPDNEGYGYF